MPRAFVIRPFDTKLDRAGVERDFERVQNELILPALQGANLAGGDTTQVIEAGNIRSDMFQLILEADLVVCDVTIDNANVFYELGIRHALRRGRTALIRAKQVRGTPFDILTERHLKYDIEKPGDSKAQLVALIQATLAAENASDSPVFHYIPQLTEALEVITAMRCELPALRAIGAALWNVGDLDGSTRCWERLRAQFPMDIEANLALANLYERVSRRKGSEHRLTDSDTALGRVLADTTLSRERRAEALANRGRNIKTRWRADWEAQESEASCRRAALSGKLLEAYDVYRKAFWTDLNHYWSGLAALQMGTIALDLSRDERWVKLFKNGSHASERVRGLEDEVQKLKSAVALAIETATMPGEKPLDIWAKISEADVRFLCEDDAEAIAQAYLDAIPRNAAFAWDSAKGQLEIFAALGARGELARGIIAIVQKERVGAEPKRLEQSELSIIVFVGHQLDEPDRATPRFPHSAELRVREAISAALTKLREELSPSPLRVLASAAPGADILCHELCIELGIESVVCLPMPKNDVSRITYGSNEAWRRRYLALIEKRAPLQLSDRVGLPNWLQGSLTDPWQRGNGWVLEMARASAKRVILVALWDGQSNDERGQGTAHMVKLARAAGDVQIEAIEIQKLIQV